MIEETTFIHAMVILVGLGLMMLVWNIRFSGVPEDTSGFDSNNQFTQDRYIRALRLLREVHRIAANDGPEGVYDHSVMDEAEVMLTFEADKLDAGYKR